MGPEFPQLTACLVGLQTVLRSSCSSSCPAGPVFVMTLVFLLNYHMSSQQCLDTGVVVEHQYSMNHEVYLNVVGPAQTKYTNHAKPAPKSL